MHEEFTRDNTREKALHSLKSCDELVMYYIIFRWIRGEGSPLSGKILGKVFSVPQLLQCIFKVTPVPNAKANLEGIVALIS